LIGLPGCGKGVVCSVLKEKGYKIVSMSSLLKKEAKKQKRIQNLMKKGKLINTKLVIKIFKKNFPRSKKVLLDGVARNSEELNATIKLLEKYKYDYLLLNIAGNKSKFKERIVNRRYCPRCSRIYNLKTDPLALSTK